MFTGLGGRQPIGGEPMKHGWTLAALALAVTTGCTQDSPQDLETAMTDLRETADAYHAAASAKDRDAVVAFYATDAVMIPPNAERVEGIAGVRNYRFGFIENLSVETRFETIRVDVSSDGDVGWTLAIVEVTLSGPDGEPGGDRIRDFHVWKRQTDGSWKIAVDIWNSENP